MDDKKKQIETEDRILDEYYAQVEGSENDTHTHVDYHDGGDSGCCC